MTTKHETSTDSTAETNGRLVRAVAGEDLHLGDRVTLLDEIVEFPSFPWCLDPQFHAKEEPVRVRYLPDDAGEPLTVEAICLPFVLVRHASDRATTLDLRRHRLVRLSRPYADAAAKALSGGGKKKKKKRDRCR